MGAHGNAGKAALSYGPFVLAYDQGRNPKAPKAIAVGFKDSTVQAADNYKPGSYLMFLGRVANFFRERGSGEAGPLRGRGPGRRRFPHLAAGARCAVGREP